MVRNFNKIKKIILVVFLFTLLFVPFITVSAEEKAKSTSKVTTFGKDRLSSVVGSQYGNTNLGTIIGSIVSAVLALAGTIFLVLTVYGGITWMTAMGNQEKIEKARNIITAAIIGGAITGGAYAITFFAMSRIGAGGGGGGGGGYEGMGCCTYQSPDRDNPESTPANKADCQDLDGSWSSGLCDTI